MFHKYLFAVLISASVPFLTYSQTQELSSDMLTVLKEHKALGPKTIERLSPDKARLQPTLADAVKSLLSKKNRTVDTSGFEVIYNTVIPTANGDLQARIYKPQGLAERAPITLYFHGGGWVLADLDVYQASAMALAKQSASLVVSVEYRKAPENKFPAAHEDAFAAYQWILDKAESRGWDQDKVAVAGESAGGNLALNTAIRARDSGLQRPLSVVLIYPVTGTDFKTPTYAQYDEAKPLNRPMMRWFFRQFTNAEEQMQDPRLNLLSANLENLPPILIVTAQVDPLRSEGAMLAGKIREQHGLVEIKNYAGVTHEFFGMGDMVRTAKQAQSYVGNFLKKHFESF